MSLSSRAESSLVLISEGPGSTTNVRYADYNNETGDGSVLDWITIITTHGYQYSTVL